MKVPWKMGLVQNDGRTVPSGKQLFVSPSCRDPNPSSVCCCSVLRPCGFSLPSWLQPWFHRQLLLNQHAGLSISTSLKERKHNWSLHVPSLIPSTTPALGRQSINFPHHSNTFYTLASYNLNPQEIYCAKQHNTVYYIPTMLTYQPLF